MQASNGMLQMQGRQQLGCSLSAAHLHVLSTLPVQASAGMLQRQGRQQLGRSLSAAQQAQLAAELGSLLSPTFASHGLSSPSQVQAWPHWCLLACVHAESAAYSVRSWRMRMQSRQVGLMLS